MISGEGQDENIQELDDSVVSAEHTSRTLVPLAFLGLGLYRAWIEIVFVG